MPVVDVAVLCATDIAGVPLRKSFCVYVRLQGQAIRTRPAEPDRAGEVSFGERFRFQYSRDSTRPGRNRMFVELWVKSLFSQACVSVAWLEMDEQRFVRGQQVRVNVRGTFEGKAATISLAVTPLDFGETPGGAPQPMQQQMPMPYQPQQPPAAVAYGRPAEGIPLESPSPYTTAAYAPNTCAVVADPMQQYHQCEPAPLPPQPQAFVGASLPPPLYPGFAQPSPSAQYPDALPAPGQQGNACGGYDYGADYPPKQPKQL